MARVPIIARYRHCTLHYSPVEAAISPRDIAYTLNSFINSSHRIQEPFALFDELYDKPWLRAGPYFIGTISGYILFKTKCQLKLPMVSISKHYPQRFCPIGLITQSISQRYSCTPRRDNDAIMRIYRTIAKSVYLIIMTKAANNRMVKNNYAE